VSISLLLDLAVGTCPDRIAVGSLQDGLSFEQVAAKVQATAALILEVSRAPSHTLAFRDLRFTSHCSPHRTPDCRFRR
jgi:hypothetical protein